MRAPRLAAALVATALALMGCRNDELPELSGVVLPGLAGSEADGSTLDVGALTGPAVINMWATWCTPCLAELPDFQRASADYPDVRFVGVDATGFRDDGESLEFLAGLGVTYEQFVDPDGMFAAAVAITELPATLIVDTDGDVQFFHQGQVSYDELAEQLAEF